MKLGVSLTPGRALELAREAERLGFATALAPEGDRDAITVLSWVAGQTERIGLVSGVCQIPGRTPVLAASTAATLNSLCGGRFRLGLGISNSFTADSRHGQPFRGPLGRTREYLEIIRMVLRGEPVRLRGEHYTVPFSEHLDGFRAASDPHATPILLAAIGPGNLELAGEIADGWIGSFCSPAQVEKALPSLRAGRERAGATLDGFEILLTVPIAVGDDPRALAEPIKRYVAKFLSLGHRERNFYYRLAAEQGLSEEADRVQSRYLAGDPDGAAAAVPFEFVDAMALLGPPDRIRTRLGQYADAGASTLCVGPSAPTLPEQRAALQVAAAVLPAGAH
ncbi:LLM class flavin-dependent oxidoreductase [Amycolatopsis nigrescens]|uniref:LLM class flavin-dependent oxidoreductase n=1 Tax=Amycolatopsis nigrescens TaxID=381445 RepID=UPI00036D79DF|nr:LLM class flavin-dependent oxidoreductase [Amycolatopsis nigrescens]